ncbi:MAG: hypothetical protein JJU11_16195 [Candidatus Sumerlaeia bacterium]|nr:hypothetical protein [Candidatus Sumerlaeia bacterium]
MPKARNWWIALGIGAFVYALSPALVGNVRPTEYDGGRSRSEAAEAERNSSAIGRLLGEMRTSFSDIMFIKTERYHHMGIAYDAHLGANPGQELDQSHAGTGTLIPPPDKDFRGFIGNLERNIRPWRDPSLAHVHSDGRELLPWYRLMTLSDPHYIRGFILGAFWLEREDPEEAMAFITEGLENNPNSFQILLTKGQMVDRVGQRIGREGGDPTPKRKRALELFIRGAEIVLQQRPPGADKPDLNWWTEYIENDARAVFQLAVLMESRLGDVDVAYERGLRYLEHIPDDRIIRRELDRIEADRQSAEREG